jgi:hypothetical protein
VNPSDAQVYGGILVLLALIVKSVIDSRARAQDKREADERHAQERQAIIDRAALDEARRARDKADVALVAEQIKAEVAIQSRQIEEKLKIQNQLQQALDQLAHSETLARLNETHETAKEAVLEAKHAYTEANHVNEKIEATNTAIEGLQGQITETLAKMPDLSPAPIVPPLAPSLGHINVRLVGATET